MARYIDADALIKELERRIEESNEAHMAIIDDDFIMLVDDADTADVRENVRGEWTMVDPDEYFLPFVCSACNGHSENEYDFCPNCGADMRGAE